MPGVSVPVLPPPVRLLAGLLFRDDEAGRGAASEAETSLVERFGPVDARSGLVPFAWTGYYEKEMGGPLLRQWISFAAPVPRGILAEAKLLTNAIEARLAGPDGRRTVNIDPGLITLENLVLASGKNFTHRIYLDCGIFAEVTLIYQNRRFNPLPWTYPDYADPEAVAFFTRLRQTLLPRTVGGVAA